MLLSHHTLSLNQGKMRDLEQCEIDSIQQEVLDFREFLTPYLIDDTPETSKALSLFLYI